MHFSFKGPKAERVRFFQSSFPYLNNNAVLLRNAGKTRKWSSEEPHPSKQPLLTFSNGHYGIYFTIFNHELRREERAGMQEAPLIVLVVPGSTNLLFMPEFFISKANQEIHNEICELKSVSRDLLSTTSLFSPKRTLRLLATRGFHTTSRLETKDADRNIHALPKIEELPEPDGEEPFEDSFKRSQVNRIVSVFASHATPAELDIIYPIYQLLKRNDIVLPSIHEYNIVLKSIVMRSLNSDSTPESTESRLTCLLTVYQDVLSACSRNALCKPNHETFDIVLSEIFKVAVQVDLGVKDTDAQTAFAKSEEFCQVGLQLFMSVRAPTDLALSQLLPNLVTAVNMHPNLLLKEVVVRILDVHDIACIDGRYYMGLITMARHLIQLGVVSLSEEAYNFMASVFTRYKEQAASTPSLVESEYDVYSSLVQSLILNDNLPIASKFLDDILLDYKRAVPTLDDKTLAHHKIRVSNLISEYIQAIMASNKPEDLNIAYNLLNRFKNVPYIPDLTVQVYNEMINRFINQYTLCEIEKANGRNVSDTQRVIYTKIWELYNCAAIRKDFQAGPLMDASYQTGLKVNCRDFLLSLSLDLSDHAQVTRLLKEILLKNHKISDWNVSKKLCLYLYNGVAAYGNSYYADLLWNVIELQATHYYGSSNALNSFLSEHVSFLLFETPANFNRVLDSYAVYNAFSSFDLLEDNVYGVMSVATYLMVHSQYGLSPTQAFKLMQMQSCLINQFEDPENHYLQLSPELIQFKLALLQLFTDLYAVAPSDMLISDDISSACQALGLDVKINGQTPRILGEQDFQKDLSALFSVNYGVAVTAFLEAFCRGFHFNQLTWNAIINQNFAIEVLEKDSTIRISDFVDRLLKLNLGEEDERHLLASIIGLKNEKINVGVLKYITANNMNLCKLDEIMGNIVDFASISDNRYFLSVLAESLPAIVTENSNLFWLTKTIRKMTEVGRTGDIVALLNSSKDKLVYGLDITSTAAQEYLHAVILALLNLEASGEVNQIFKHYFNGKEGNRILLESDKLLECLVHHYIVCGAYEDVLNKFAFLQNRSAELSLLIEFARFMSGLSGKECSGEVVEYKNPNTFGLAILNEKNLLHMKNIFEGNKRLVRDKEQFYNFLVSSLTKASTLTGDLYNSQITRRFESIIKFCKVMRLLNISVDTLINTVKFLAVVKSTDLLNILVNKFVHGTTLSPFVNLYFLHVDVRDEHDASRLLAALKNALIQVGDEMNVEMIAEYETAMV